MANEIVIRELDTEKHEQSGSLLVQEAMSAVIETNDDRELAGPVVRKIEQEIKAIEMEFYGTPEQPAFITLAHRTWKGGIALFEKAVASRRIALDTWKKKIKKFEFDVEQKRLEEQAKANAKAQKEAEEERRRQIEEARKAKDKLAEQALKEAPLEVQAVAPKTPEVSKADGLRRSNPEWDFDMIDENKLPRRYLTPDLKAIRASVKALGLKHGIPGINVFDRRSRGV